MIDKIIIGGDFYIPDRISSIKPSELFSEEIRDYFRDADFNTVNLEAPICEKTEKERIVKTGPHLNCGTYIFEHLKYLNIHGLSLANNHILDYGEYGLKSTFQLSSENGFAYFGAGVSLEEASKVFYKKLKNATVAIINVAENEWSGAKMNKAGANPFDVFSLVRDIREAKKNADFVFVIIHGGHEYYQLPSPLMVKTYRFLIDEGVDAVVGHHTHCFSGYEVYKESPIFYSIGNFVFPSEYEKARSWHEGTLVKFTINNKKELSFELLPYIQNFQEVKVRQMESKERKTFFENVDKQREVITNQPLLEEKWSEWLDSKEKYYLSIFSNSNLVGNGIVSKIINKLKLQKLFISKAYLKNIVNSIRCESHYEISKQILENYLEKR